MIRYLRILPAFVLVVLTAGCLKVDLDVTVSEDERVSGVVVMGVSKEFARNLGQSPEALAQGIMKQGEQPPKGVKREAFSDDRYAGVKLVMDGVALKDFNSTNAAAQGDDDLRIQHRDGRFIVTGGMDLDAQGLKNNPLFPSIEKLANQMDVQVRLTFPGKIVESNGSVEGATVTWRPKFGQKAKFHAIAEDSPGLGWLLPVAAGGLLLLLGLIAFLVLRSRRPQPMPPPPSWPPQV